MVISRWQGGTTLCGGSLLSFFSVLKSFQILHDENMFSMTRYDTGQMSPKHLVDAQIGEGGACVVWFFFLRFLSF